MTQKPRKDGFRELKSKTIPLGQAASCEGGSLAEWFRAL